MNSVHLRVEGRYCPMAYRLPEAVVIDAPLSADDAFSACVDVYLNRALQSGHKELTSEGMLGLRARIVKTVEAGLYQKNTILIEGNLATRLCLPCQDHIVLHTGARELPEIRIPVTVRENERRGVLISPSTLAFGVLNGDECPSKRVVLSWPVSARMVKKSVTASAPDIVAEEGGESVRNGQVSMYVTCRLRSRRPPGRIAEELRVVIGDNEYDGEYSIPITGFVKDRP